MKPRCHRRRSRGIVAAVATTALFSSVAIASAHHISGQVWSDLNNSGTIDAGEPGIAGVTVHVENMGGVSSAKTGETRTTVTDATGHYSFGLGTNNGLGDGNFAVWIDLPSAPLTGCSSSTGILGSPTGPYEPAPDPNNKSLDNTDRGQLGTGPDGSPAIVTSQLIRLRTVPSDPAAAFNDTVDFGFFCPSSLGGLTWNDLNHNGLRDTAEPVIGGVAVTLLNPQGGVVATTTTDASGHYQFTGLVPTTYTVRFATPAGYEPTVPNSPNGSDINAAGLTGPVTLAPLENDPNVDAGFFQPPPVTQQGAPSTPTPVVSPPVKPRAVKARLTIRKTAPAKAKAGSLITYVITVRNPSKTTARGVLVQDLLPRGLTVAFRPKVQSVAAILRRGGLNWSLGTLGPGRSRVIRVTVRVGANVKGRISNTATVRGKNVAGVKRATASTLISAIAPRAPRVTG